MFPGSLHNHTDSGSNLRLRDAICTYDELIDYAIELGHRAIAFTEHESVSNAVKIEKYYKKIKAKSPEFRVILGNEIYLCRDGLTAENKTAEDKFFHFILLAKNAKGHQQIRELSTRAWKRSFTHRSITRVPTYYQDLIDIVYADPGNVIASTACLGGWLGTQILKSDYKRENVISWLSSMKKLFGEDFYLELQPADNNEQRKVNREIVDISKELNIPYIITTDTHYARKKNRKIHKAFLNAQDGDREVDDFYATTYLMDTTELESYLTDHLTIEEIALGYNSINEIIDKCEDYSLLKPLKIPRLKWKEINVSLAEVHRLYKDIPYLKVFMEQGDEAAKTLAYKVVEGIVNLPECNNKAMYEEVDKCLEMTWISSQKNNASWSSYFLNLQNIIEECWKSGTIIGCGRGSGVGFVLLYLLEITQINPLRETTPLYRWRFLNPDRVSVLDVDIDIEGGRRAQVLQHLRQVYGEDRVANVVTFKTEKSKSAIQTAARGLELPVEVSLYISSLIPSDRGQTRTLHQCYYGDEENGFKPIPLFIQQMKMYPELWEVAQKIENLVCGVGEHAGGVIFVDEPFTNSTALMRVPNGDLVTQFDLHDAEDCSLIKYDLLSVEGFDKIHTCLDLLCEYGYVERKPTLKETYESVLGIYNLEREDIKMWEMVWKHEIQSLFQMEQQSGIQGITLTKPKSVDDLATLNSVIRLMASEKGQEQPLHKFARFRQNIKDWYAEMEHYGLTKEEQTILEPILLPSSGICEAQEAFMQLVQVSECGGFNLTWADRLRKVIAKKKPAEYNQLTKEYFETVEEKGLSKNLCNYVWNVLIATSRGYGFNKSHTLAYSLVALQEMNLAFKYPIIFWNCACLITDSGGGEETQSEAKSTDYNKIATAIGKMSSNGVKIVPPDINKSLYSFYPDAENNQIYFGLRGLTNVGEDVVTTILQNRPYNSIKDFYVRVKPKKQSMISLIKSGAFDSMEDRKFAMAWYIWETCDKKKRITLQNMPGLIKYDLVPKETANQQMACRVYEFNRYLKAKCKTVGADVYTLDTRAIEFLNELGCADLMKPNGTSWVIEIKTWDKVYKTWMDEIRNYITAHQQEVLDSLNQKIFLEDWGKYALGTISSWEMEALCFYYHEHELANVNFGKYGIMNFFNLSEEPVVERSFTKGDKTINLFKLTKIAGTCIAKNKDKGLVSILTTNGVVDVKFNKEYFAMFNKRISEVQEDGTKKIVEKSWFDRGNLILVQGMRSGNLFMAKKYQSTGGHQLYHIDKIENNGDLILRNVRKQGEYDEES